MLGGLNALEEVVRQKICGVCSERKADNSCGLEDPGECALFRLFPEVAAAIQSVDSVRLEDYIAAIRQKVCTICVGQNAEGSCASRDEVRCSLDAYLLLIVEAIEEATGRNFGRPLPDAEPGPNISIQN